SRPTCRPRPACRGLLRPCRGRVRADPPSLPPASEHAGSTRISAHVFRLLAYRRGQRNRLMSLGAKTGARGVGVAVISEATKAFVEGVAGEAERLETPCGDGHLVWHSWGSGRPLVLLHGGYGSWTHWIRNVLPLSRQFRVLAPDLPGLGESATPPEPWTAKGLAAIVVGGIDRILPREGELRLAGFSFGGVIGGSVAALLGDRLRSFTVVGSNGLGLERSPTPLRRVPPDAD